MIPDTATGGSALHRGEPAFNPALETLLGENKFPQDRDTILRYARDNDAGPAVMERLEKMPARTYNSIEDFRSAFGEELENYGTVAAPDVETAPGNQATS